MEKGARRGDTISVFLFILALETNLIIIKSNKQFHLIGIVSNDLLTLHMQMTLHFLSKHKNLLIELLNTFNKLSSISGLKLKKSKYKAAGISTMIGIIVEFCGLKYANLEKKHLRTLGYHCL